MNTFITFLSRNKAYTAVNIAGLSISLAFVIVIGLYSQMEFGRDKWHEKAGRIYCLGSKMTEGSDENSHYCMQDYLRQRFAEIENSCGVMYDQMDIEMPNQDKQTVRMMFTDPSFFNIFDFPVTIGDRRKVLEAPNNIVLEEKAARLLFGDSNPMGKTVTLNDSLKFTVSGVMPQLNHTIFHTFAAIVRMDVRVQMGDNYSMDKGMWSYGNTAVYLLEKAGCNLKDKEKAMNEALSKDIWLFKPDCIFGQSKVELVPFTSLYFSELNSVFTSRGDRQQSRLLFVAGIVILLFAVMNYINLSVAQSGMRMREMAMRRLLGSQRHSIVCRLTIESVALCLLSLVIAVAVVWLIVPYANQLVRSTSNTFFWWIEGDASDIPIIQFADIWKPQVMALLVAAAVVLGMVAGIAPALITSSAQPIEVVRGSFRRRTKMFFSKIFIVVQHVITIVLMGVSLTMWLQVNHLVNAPLGYKTDRLMEVSARSWSDNDMEKMGQLYNMVRSLPCIETASLGVGTPLTGGSNQTMTLDGKTIAFQQFWNTRGWIKMMGIKVLADYGTSSYSESGKTRQRVFVTRSALQAENLPDDARSLNLNGEQLQIDGIVADFHLKDILFADQRPVIVREFETFNRGSRLQMRYRGDKNEARRQVGELYRKVFGKDMMDTNAFNFFEQELTSCYANQIRIERLVGVFTLVALIISTLGLVAMSTYFIQQRRQEIAVRKVFGSSNGEMLRRLLLSFMLYVAIAFVISIPIIYYIAGEWLTQYAYRIALSPWIFIASGLTCFIISLFAIFVQSRRTANLNPIENLNRQSS